ncbi:F-box/WD repeat-containing protein 5 [Mactra antiquata]
MSSQWQDFIPDCLLLDIFTYLDVSSLGCVAQVCQTWYRISKDEHLWLGIARRKLKVKGSLAPGKESWYNEIKRLLYHVPAVCVETIHGHKDEVLDVAISNNGRYFCTCSKDAHIVMWEFLQDSTSMIKDFDAGQSLRWELSQYSVFNPDDSLILNFGTKSFVDIPEDEDLSYHAGLGAVFTVPDLELVTLVEMNPPTLFGAWLNESTFITGVMGSQQNTFHIQVYKPQLKQKEELKKYITAEKSTPLKTLSQIYEQKSQRLCTFHGSYNHLMSLLVASVPNTDEANYHDANCDNCTSQVSYRNSSSKERSNVCSRLHEGSRSPHDHFEGHKRKLCIEESDICKVKVKGVANSSSNKFSESGNNVSFVDMDTNTLTAVQNRLDTNTADESTVEDNMNEEPSSSQSLHYNQSDLDNIANMNSGRNSTQIICTNKKKYVIFVTGNHDRIAIHDITDKCNKLNDISSVLDGLKTGENATCGYDSINRLEAGGESIYRLEAGDEGSINRLEAGGEDIREEASEQTVEDIHNIYLLKHCYITGIGLSHDQRYLYFNYRELDKNNPANQVDGDIDELPTSFKCFCKELKLGCIDLRSMTRLMEFEFTGHVGYSSWPAWYICLAASLDYVGSGSEDMRGYIWDKHYGICVGILSHSSLDTGDETFHVLSELMNDESSNVVNGFAFNPIDQETCVTVCDDNLIKIWKSKNRVKNKNHENKYTPKNQLLKQNNLW